MAKIMGTLSPPLWPAQSPDLSPQTTFGMKWNAEKAEPHFSASVLDFTNVLVSEQPGLTEEEWGLLKSSSLLLMILEWVI